MTIAHTASNQELEDEGEDELTVAALRYTGPQSVYNTTALRNQGYFPSVGVLQGGPNGEPGPWVVALIPSKRLGFYETHRDLEIDYSKEAVAEALVEKNTLPSTVFGPNEDPNVRDRILDLLEMDTIPRTNEGIREQLAEIAGEEVDAGQEAEEEGFDFDLTRSELWSVCKPLDPPFDWNGLKVTEAEEFLQEQDDDTVRRLVNQLKQGEDPSLEEDDDADNGGDN